MKVLWAPWRMSYILSERKNKNTCIFCPGEDRSQDAERLILFSGERTLVMMNRFPYNNGHLLVAPVKHVAALEELGSEEMADLFLTVRKSIGVLKKQMKPEGFNVGLNLGHVAGAGIEEHLHFHVVPRWNGDTNYMTILDDVRVIPEHIQETYEKLRPDFL
ncbi:MAG: HIT domain-containing protein [Desulfobacteraceae bacterium]|nr:MAG: HIT domain-containing protein [Desulfobacteraceae bacterium]